MPSSTTPVNVGLYFDLRNPPQWRQDPARLHAFALELCEEAEHLGAHSVWLTEHHQFDDDYIASPLTFAAAVAARTKRVRIGTAIVIAPLHHPAEIAEQAAMVDLVSNGRLDLGLGAGYRVPGTPCSARAWNAATARPTLVHARYDGYGAPVGSRPDLSSPGRRSGWVIKDRKGRGGPAFSVRACSARMAGSGSRTATGWPRVATSRAPRG